jgi:rSAM/selenodomain-associated transferase 1
MSVTRVAAAVFVKTPGYSPLKTRLAAELGSVAAEEFHRIAAQCVEETLLQSSRQLVSNGVLLTPCWAVAEEAAMDHPLWSGFPTISQGTGGLGARMHAVYRQLSDQHDSVLLMGADSPAITPAIIDRAIARLQSDSYVIGEANDGGFYLLGGTQPIPLDLWERVPYSSRETSARMIEELSARGSIGRVETLLDVDVLNDLREVLPKLKAFSEATAQRQLATWIVEKLKTEH